MQTNLQNNLYVSCKFLYIILYSKKYLITLLPVYLLIHLDLIVLFIIFLVFYFLKWKHLYLYLQISYKVVASLCCCVKYEYFLNYEYVKYEDPFKSFKWENKTEKIAVIIRRSKEKIKYLKMEGGKNPTFRKIGFEYWGKVLNILQVRELFWV